ncbi:MAG: peptidoglycan-binding protein [Sulfurimonas sp.]|nr:peptidoglycan-binding protein [Sulfurimonas sp.]PHQ91398.1 MAG: hypothetical protein COB42_03545 [Sulfurimonas sp.]
MHNSIKISLITASALLSITGCSTMSNDVTKDQEIQRLTQELTTANAKVAQLDGTSQTSQETNDTSTVSNSLIPPNAKTGECYARVLVPAVYENATVQRLREEAKTNVKVIPATYKLVEKRVTIREASTKLVPVAATYKTITEEIMVKPEKTSLVVLPATYKNVTQEVMVTGERTELSVVPATYKTTTQEMIVTAEKTELKTIPTTYKMQKEEVLVTAAYSIWKRGEGAIQKLDDSTGEIMCLVEVPAKYKTVHTKVVDVAAHTQKVVTPAVYKTITTKDTDVAAHTQKVITPAVYKTITTQVIVTPSTTKEVITPAVYKTVSTQVIDTPATTREIEIPCISKIVKTRVEDTPAQEVKTDIPAVYETYTTTSKTSDSYLRWQEILCETNINPNVISKVQTALKEKNYDITMIDGIYGKETTTAIKAYQKDNQLSQGALTLKTLESLGM